MNKNQIAKSLVVDEIRSRLSEAKAAVLVDYRGLTVEQDTELRREMRKNDIEYKVLKNTLIRRAADELGMNELTPFLEGPSAIAFSSTDPVAPAKVLSDCIKKTNKMEFKAGYVEGKFCDAAALAAIASLPSREVLIAKMLGSLNAPVCNFLYAINAIIEKQGGTGEEAPAAEA
jgi:large subunit ribosomal protein L10